MVRNKGKGDLHALRGFDAQQIQRIAQQLTGLLAESNAKAPGFGMVLLQNGAVMVKAIKRRCEAVRKIGNMGWVVFLGCQIHGGGKLRELTNKFQFCR
jgi:hypothetical protein